MKNRIYIIIFSLLLLAGCKGGVTDTSGEARKKATEIPELPYILEGDYTPDTGVMYKVIIGHDTCFVVIDSIVDDQLYGYYYQLFEGSDCVERKEFTHDAHWKNQRKDALVYIYQEPEFHFINDSVYRLPKFKVRVTRDIEYGQALGYWTSMPGTEEMSYLQILGDGILNSIVRTTQSLKMDVYQPDIENIDHYRNPLVLLLHGGGFYVGDKRDSLISGLCRHFASMGYIAVSANYRLGFLPSKGEIARTGFMALQDAHAALRYLVDHAEQYGIDTSSIFVGGASAGAITSLNLAFMRDEDRPKAISGKRWRDLGAIASSGNSSKSTFHIKAVANMWGALTSLNMLKNSKTDIISFHGDADQVVPYDNGFPFNDMSIKLGKRMFDRMYGSMQIDKRARELGLHSELNTFPGEGHSLHRNPDGTWNQKNFEFIRNKMTAFFYKELKGEPPVIENDRDNPRLFYIGKDGVSEVQWKVEGGFIVRYDYLAMKIWVVWDSNAPRHRIYASGLNAAPDGSERQGAGFDIKLDIDLQKQ